MATPRASLSPLFAVPQSARALLLCALLGGILPVAAGCQPPPAWTAPVTGLAPIVLGVWGSSPTDVWAVGGSCDLAHCSTTAQSLVLHFDGTTWNKLVPPTSSVLWWVTGFGPGDVWMAGQGGTILHYSASGGGAGTWTTAQTPSATDTLYGIWGSSGTDLWAVGGQPDLSSTVLRSTDGVHFTATSGVPPVGDARIGGTWYKVWGSAPSDVWLVGQRATLAHWDGTAWSRADVSGAGVSATMGLFTAAGRAANDVYVVGGDPARGVAIHYDGSAWSKVQNLDLSQTSLLTGVYETAAGEVVITGMQGAKFVRPSAGAPWRDDSALAPYDDLHASWMKGPTDIFAVGGNFNALIKGTVAHYGQVIPSTVK